MLIEIFLILIVADYVISESMRLKTFIIIIIVFIVCDSVIGISLLTQNVRISRVISPINFES